MCVLGGVGEGGGGNPENTFSESFLNQNASFLTTFPLSTQKVMIYPSFSYRKSIPLKSTTTAQVYESYFICYYLRDDCKVTLLNMFG